MTPRATRGAVDGNSGIEEKRATELDARRGNGEFRRRHVSGKRLEETLGLLEEIGVIARQSGFRDETGNACACDHECDETND